MGLISRVSSRTYREKSIFFQKCFFDEPAPSPPGSPEDEISTTSQKNELMAITRFGLVTSENHHRLSPVLISQAGLHTLVGQLLVFSCGSGLLDQSSETENSDEKLSANTSTHNLKSLSARPNRNDEILFKPSLMLIIRMMMRKMTNKLRKTINMFGK